MTGIPVPDLGAPQPTEQIPGVVETTTLKDQLPPKRDRSRRRGGAYQPPAPAQAPEPATQPLAPAEHAAISRAIGMGFRVLFQIAAGKRGAHWALTPEDEKLLGDAWTDAATPWLATSAKYAPLAGAMLLTVGVVVPRIQHDAELVAALPPEPPQALAVVP